MTTRAVAGNRDRWAPALLMLVVASAAVAVSAPGATASSPPPETPAAVPLEPAERLLRPVADVASVGVEAVPDRAGGGLHAAIDDGTSFEEADDAGHVRAVRGRSLASHRVALSEAPSGNVVRATVHLRASADGGDTTVRVRLFDRERLVASSPARPLSPASSWVDLAEPFEGLAISSAANLRVETVFDEHGLLPGTGRYSMLWVRVGLRVSLAFAPAGLAGGGTYTAVAVPSRGPTVLVGSARGGLHRSADDGASFVPRNAAMTDPPFLRVASVSYHPTRPGTVYAVTGTRGRDSAVVRSEDDGATWRVLTGVPQFSAVPGSGSQRGRPLSVGQLLAARDDPDGVTWFWAATYEQGVMRSSDGGVTWHVIGLAGQPLRGLALSPDDPDTLYVAAHGSGTWVTSDARAADPAFTVVPGSPPDVEEVAIVGRTLYVAGAESGLFRLEAGALDAVDTGVAGGASAWVAVGGYEADGTEVVVAACGPCQAEDDGSARSIIRSTDGGVTWMPAAGPSALDLRPIGSLTAWPLARTRPDLLPGDPGFVAHQVVGRAPPGPGEPGLLLVAAEGAVWRSADDGATWRPVVQGLGGVSARSLASDGRARLLAGVVGLGLIRSDDGMRQLSIVDHATMGVRGVRSPVVAGIAMDASSAAPVLAVADDSGEPAGAVLIASDPLRGADWLDTGFADAAPGLGSTTRAGRG
jgi:hypothetical protein